MQNYANRKSITAVMTLTVSVLAGCVSTPDQQPGSDAITRNEVPQWAVAISEPVELIQPEADTDIAMQASEGTEVDWVPRGMPTDLTTRLEESMRTNNEKRHQPGDTRGSGRHTGVVVNINNVDHAGDDDATASEPNKISLAPLERMYRGDYQREADRALVQFGYDYFKQSSKPASAGPVPDSYVLGPGDEVTIAVSGTEDAYYKLEVDRDGRITIPEIGVVSVSGVRFDRLGKVINAAFAEKRRGYELTVGMGRVRKIQVHVVGAVSRPGLIELHAGSTLLDALTAVGGPSKSGTLRKIAWRRKGVNDQKIDLYDFFVGGQQPPVDVLLQGDIIHVPAIGSTVGIAGYVQRPGIYELSGELTLDKAIEAAGGFTPFTFTPRIQVEQTVDGRGRETLDIDMSGKDAKRTLNDGEMLLIGAVDDRLQPIVRIEGEVVRPGSFQYRGGMKVSDLIELSDGLTIDAYTKQAFISRQVGTTGTIALVTDRVRESSSRRVMVIDLRKALAKDPAHDIELFPLDQLSVRSRMASRTQPVVEVLGAVQKPGRYELTTGLRVSELIALAGNVLPEVHYDEAEIIRRVHNEETGQLDVKRYRFNLGKSIEEGGRFDPVLENSDRLVIRKMRRAEVKAKITGLVRFPGEYVFPEGAKITDLIAAAGGLVDHADMRAAAFTRQSVRQLQSQRFQHLTEQTQRKFEDALRTMVQTGRPREGVAAKLALQDTEQLMDRMKNTEATGRVVIPFTREAFPKSDYNLALESGDTLHIPRQQQTVSIIGCVFTPNSFVAVEGITVKEALDRVGGTTEFADDERVYVIRADGNVESLLQNGKKRLSLAAELLPGDVVLVPREAPARTAGAKMVDTLTILRHAVELGLIGSQVGQPIGDFNYSTISDLNDKSNGINAYQEAILERTKR